MMKSASAPIVAPSPSAAEIDAVLKTLRSSGALCWAKVLTGNTGLVVSLSFRPPVARSQSGEMEVALRRAEIHVTCDGSMETWDWNRDFLEFAKGETTAVERTVNKTETASLGTSDQGEVKAEGEAKLRFLGLAAKVGAGVSSRRDARKDATRGQSEKVVEIASGVQVYNGPDHYGLILDARPHPDLVARNSQLNRVSLIDVIEPSSVQPEAVRMALNLHIEDGEGQLRHAFRIRWATGSWGVMANDPNKRILGELLFSKFLLPLHEPSIIWPLVPGTT